MSHGTFFETFPVVLVDRDGIVRANVPFSRVESKYRVEQVCVTVEFYGGEHNGVSCSDPAIVKKYARRAQLGENFELDHATLKSDDVFRSSPRAHAEMLVVTLFGCHNTVTGALDEMDEYTTPNEGNANTTPEVARDTSWSSV
ncbi:hypothetical protein Dsin_013340 [Dipteronia sinensis]|uniref:Uncharacterized protein n=1 Tax=Dipteronia sinensis TaxID=43782 RepID=A0AAE0EAH1_9ROSI|nr:hypothetical protein Dsin_013340 [Dipteronia sinensis]